MTKKPTYKELERISQKKDWWLALMIFITLVSVLSCVFYGITNDITTNKLKEKLQTCEVQAYCSDTFRESMGDSCLIGCIYSTKFYYDNPEIDFKEASYDCMLNCIKTAKEVQDNFSFCEVIK